MGNNQFGKGLNDKNITSGSDATAKDTTVTGSAEVIDVQVKDEAKTKATVEPGFKAKITPDQHDHDEAEPKKRKNSNVLWVAGTLALVVVAGVGIYYSDIPNASVETSNTTSEVTEQANTSELTQPTLATESTASADTEEAVSQAQADGNSEPSSASSTQPQIESASESSVDVSNQAQAGKANELTTETSNQGQAESANEPTTATSNQGQAKSVNEPTAETSNNSQAESVGALKEDNAAVSVGKPDASNAGNATSDNAKDSESPANVLTSAQTTSTAEYALNDTVVNLQQQVAQQAAEIAELKKTINLAQKKLIEVADVNPLELTLNDVGRLIQSADNELKINANQANAINILEVAQQTLRQSNNVVFAGLQGAIAADIVTLKTSKVDTTDKLFEAVNLLSTQLDQAALKTTDNIHDLQDHARGKAQVADTTNSSSYSNALPLDAPWYDTGWAKVKDWAVDGYESIKLDLKNIVRVEKLDDPELGLLSIEQAGILRANLKMQLTFAQQALLSKQQTIWESSLNNVRAAVQKYFSPETANAQQIQQLLQQLQQSVVTERLPDLTQTQAALRETFAQVKALSNPQE